MNKDKLKELIQKYIDSKYDIEKNDIVKEIYDLGPRRLRLYGIEYKICKRDDKYFLDPIDENNSKYYENDEDD